MHQAKRPTCCTISANLEFSQFLNIGQSFEFFYWTTLCAWSKTDMKTYLLPKYKQPNLFEILSSITNVLGNILSFSCPGETWRKKCWDVNYDKTILNFKRQFLPTCLTHFSKQKIENWVFVFLSDNQWVKPFVAVLHYSENLTVYVTPVSLNIIFEVSPSSVSKYPHTFHYVD